MLTSKIKNRLHRPSILLFPAIIVCCLFSISVTIILYYQIRADLSLQGKQILDQIETMRPLLADSKQQYALPEPIIDKLLATPDVSSISITQNGQEKLYEKPTAHASSNTALFSNQLFGGEHSIVRVERELEHTGSSTGLQLAVELNPVYSGRYLIYLVLSSLFFVLLFSVTLLYLATVRSKKQQKADVSSTNESHSSFSPLSILVADDNEISCKILSAYLNNLGHSAAIVNGGEAVLEELKDNKYDLLIIDLHMPELNGAETVKLIRGQRERYNAIPIIGLSADSSRVSVQQSLAAGMNEFIVKPVNQAELKNVLKRWQSGNETGHSRPKVHDLDSLRSMLIAELPDYRHTLEIASRSADHQYLYQTAHKIAGGSVYCEIPLLEEAAMALQSAAQKNDQSAVVSETRRLINVIDSTLEEYSSP